MDVDLDERRVTNAVETVYLSGLDDKDVTCAGFELLSIDGPEPAAFSDELHFIVRMSMRARTTARKGVEEEHGDVHVTVIGANETVRAALEGQIMLTDAVHRAILPPKEPGGKITKAAQRAQWGGYFGYFADPDGYLWNVAAP